MTPTPLSLSLRPPDWMVDALCPEVDADLFFPEAGGTARAAKAVCRRCEVQSDCLEYALAHNIGPGVWGGATERERDRIRAERAAGRRRAPVVAVGRGGQMRGTTRAERIRMVVARVVRDGMTVPAAAEALGVTVRTAERYLADYRATQGAAA